METLNFAMPLVFIISLAASFLAVGLILKLSHKYKWYDHIDDRKVHDGEIPRLGGVGFAVSFFIAAVIISFLYWQAEEDMLPCLFALLLILGFGIFDDFHPLKPRYKLLVQFAAALIVIIPGFYFKRFVYLDAGVLPLIAGYAVTLLWFVGITNAINLIDGIDGLAAGLSAIIALFFGLIFFYYSSNPIYILFCAAFIGVICGFLFFNAPFPKAKIFMGDCGSQFIGFFLALLPLLPLLEADMSGRAALQQASAAANAASYDALASYNMAALPVFYAAALFLIPIFDTTAAVWRRVRDGMSIHTPDKSHVHHKLLNLGFSVKGVNALLCGLQIVLGVLVFTSIRIEGAASLYVLGSAYLISIIFFTVIHFSNRANNKKQKVIK